MARIEREDIHIISRHSNWSEKEIDEILKKDVYNDKKSWLKFLRLFFISLGISFTIAGVLFFFAYNWTDLHKFVKIGLIEGLIILVTVFVLFSKLNEDVKNILITGVSMLVGVLFAVFGQIYQTGANAYDFFLGWTMSIVIWVVISNFAPLWLLFITLINTTFILYSQQVANDWSDVFVVTLLFAMNISFLIISLYGKIVFKELKLPTWFSNFLVLACVSYSTIGITMGIFNENQSSFIVLILITSILYGIGIKYGLKVRSSFYLSIIPFSIIFIICAFLMKLSYDGSMFFFISLFVIASVTFVIKNLINLQKKWTD